MWIPNHLQNTLFNLAYLLILKANFTFVCLFVFFVGCRGDFHGLHVKFGGQLVETDSLLPPSSF